MSEKDRNNALQEGKILEQLNHPSIIKFIEVIIEKQKNITPTITTLHIVMEYADGGDLLQRIKQQNGKLFSEETIIDWFTQICLAIKHIHDRKILHRDIKSQNIFMTKKGNVQLGDFGIAKCLNQTLDTAKTLVGTPYYLSPEIINNEPYDFKSDIWSLGVLLYEMCTLSVPFTAQNFPQLIVKIIKGVYPPIASSFSKELMALIKSLLNANKNQRPNINQVLKHSIIKGKIKNFLNDQQYQREFSHTLLHKFNILDENKGEDRQSVDFSFQKNNKHRSTEKQLRYDQHNDSYEINKSENTKRRPTENNKNYNQQQQNEQPRQQCNIRRSKNISYKNIHDSKNVTNSKKKDIINKNEAKYQYIPQSQKALIYSKKAPISSHSKSKCASEFNIFPQQQQQQQQQQKMEQMQSKCIKKSEINQNFDDDIFSFPFDTKYLLNQQLHNKNNNNHNRNIKESSKTETAIDSFINNKQPKSKEKIKDDHHHQKKNLILEEFMKNKHEKIKHSLIISDSVWFKNNNIFLNHSPQKNRTKDNDKIQSQQMLEELENFHFTIDSSEIINSIKEPDNNNDDNIIINNNTYNDSNAIFPLYNMNLNIEEEEDKEEIIQCNLDNNQSYDSVIDEKEEKEPEKILEKNDDDNAINYTSTFDNSSQHKIRDTIRSEMKNELGIEFYNQLYSFIRVNITDDIIQYDIEKLNNKIQMTFTEVSKAKIKKALLYIPDIYFLILTAGDD